MTTNTIERDELEEDRGLPSVNDRRASSSKKGVIVIFVGLVLLLGMGFAWWAVMSGGDAAEKPEEKALESSVPPRLFGDAPPAPDEVPQDVVVAPVEMLDPATGEPVPSATPGGVAPAPAPRPTWDKSASELMVVDAGDGEQGGDAAAPGTARAVPPAAGGGNSGGDSGALASYLESTQTSARLAGKLPDRNLLLAKGSFIDCALQTRLDTTVPGMAKCVVTRNVFSDNGNVLLIERGSTVTGQYAQGLQEGQARIFVLWDRVTTPNGVAIALDSPGTDPLGASGLPGRVKTHFWKRFGAAMLLSVVEDATDYVANRNRGQGDTYNYGGNSSDAASDMASKTLDKTINIPPTLYKNQGDRINIFVARDISFASVYALRAR